MKFVRNFPALLDSCLGQIDQLGFRAIVVADPYLNGDRREHRRDQHREQRENDQGQNRPDTFSSDA